MGKIINVSSNNDGIIDGAFLVSAGVKQCGRKRTFCDAKFENGYRISKAKLTNINGFISKSCASGIGGCSIFEITFTDGTQQTFTTTKDDLSYYLSSVLDLSTIKTCNFKQIKSTVTNISGLFSVNTIGTNCFNMTSFICEACLGNVTNMGGTWSSCSSLTSFPAIDTSSVTSMDSTWSSCSSLTSFPAIDTSSVTSMDSTWSYCSSLTSFPAIDTSSVTYMDSTWFSCSSLTSFPAIDTSSVTYMDSTWSYCSSLTSFGGVSNCSQANSTTWENTLLNPKPCGQ